MSTFLFTFNESEWATLPFIDCPTLIHTYFEWLSRHLIGNNIWHMHLRMSSNATLYTAHRAPTAAIQCHAMRSFTLRPAYKLRQCLHKSMQFASWRQLTDSYQRGRGGMTMWANVRGAAHDRRKRCGEMHRHSQPEGYDSARTAWSIQYATLRIRIIYNNTPSTNPYKGTWRQWF